MQYIWQRLISNAKGSSSTWEARKAFLGPTNYTSSDSWSGEEQLLFGFSWLMQRDMRPHFDAWGVGYSTRASNQVASWGLTPQPARYFYKPINHDGKFWSPAAYLGSVPLTGSDVPASLPKVPMVYTWPGAYGVDPPSTFPARKTLPLTLVLGAKTGVVSFSANGAPITNCTALNVAYKAYTTDNKYYAAVCNWVPQTSGSFVINATVTGGLPSGLLTPYVAPYTVTVVDSPGAPAVTSLSRPSGLPGTMVQLGGAYLNATDSVTFNGFTCAFTVDGASQLTVTIPSGVPPSLFTGVFTVSQLALGFTAYSPSFTILSAVTGVSLSPSQLSLNKGQVASIAVTVSPSYASNSAVMWDTSDVTVATVTSAGVVTAVGALGTATITATSVDGRITGSATVSVVSAPVVRVVRIVPSAAIARVDVGATANAPSVTVYPNTATVTSVTWSSSNTAVATVTSAGVITGVAIGTANLTVTASDGGTSALVALVVEPAVTADDTADTVNGIVATTHEWSTDNGRSWTTYSGSNMPSLAGNNMVLRVRQKDTPSIVKALIFTAGAAQVAAFPQTQWNPLSTYVTDLVSSWTSSGNGYGSCELFIWLPMGRSSYASLFL